MIILTVGPVTLLKITLKLSITSQDIKVSCRARLNNSLSNTFKILLLLERDHQNYEAVLAATGMNGLSCKGYF